MKKYTQDHLRREKVKTTHLYNHASNKDRHIKMQKLIRHIKQKPLF